VMFGDTALRHVYALAGRGEHVQATAYLAGRARELTDALNAAGLAHAKLLDGPEPETVGEAIGQALHGAALSVTVARRFDELRAHLRHVDRFAAGVLVAGIMRTRPATTLSELCESA
jgi:hypothetical protein